MKNIKSKFVDKDGKLNGKMVAGVISLLIVLVQQIFAAFGIKFTGDLAGIVACINTILAILGLIGVMTEPATISVDTSAIEDAVSTANQAATTASLAIAKANEVKVQNDVVVSQIASTNDQISVLNNVVSSKIK